MARGKMRRTSSQCALLFAHDISTQAVAWRRKCDRRRLLGLLRLRWLASSFCELSERHWPPLKKLGRHKLPWSTFADASSHAALGEAQSIQGFSGGGSTDPSDYSSIDPSTAISDSETETRLLRDHKKGSFICICCFSPALSNSFFFLLRPASLACRAHIPLAQEPV